MRDAFPLGAGGKAAAAPSSQVGFLDFLQYLLRSHPGKGLGKRGIAADGQVVVDALRIDTAVGAEDDALLVLVEGDLRFVDDLFVGGRVGIEQTLDDLLLLYGLGDDLGNILRLYLEIADLLRADDDDRTPLAEPVAAGLPDIDRVTQSLVFRSLLQVLAATSRLPEAWQADPEQRVMQGLFGSLFERISFLNSSNSAGEFIRDIMFPYS